MKNLKLNKSKLILISALFLIFYNEILVYWLAYLKWPQLDDKNLIFYKNGSKIANINDRPVRLLLVADPQLIGENDEPWYLSWLAQWDCDRYLKSGFNYANSYTKPDATIYLGDLFDEGLKSSDEQVERYYQRFKSIYQFDKMLEIYNTKQIFISGDNDIGGEYQGDRNTQLVERFEKYFGPNVDLINFNSFINFLKLDLDYVSSFYDGSKREYVRDLIKLNQNDKYTIILNHISILRGDRDELIYLSKDTKAGLIIKGDSHLFEIIKYSFETHRSVEYINWQRNPSNLYKMNLERDTSRDVKYIYELSIPTCSYRMGVPNMGYGVLTLYPNGNAIVSILWLPSRFFSIKLYIIYIFFVAILLPFFSYCFKKSFFKTNNVIIYNKRA
ncbi:unnamed protein product [Brachionus calyciflorus]|uniref:Calcineurin-like phosphoesterase domain-containing protein n=1 Tax=Brachionus calyciflorus TaxID=104777 RepID=A0A814A037_9BILA|nr:unnamed protein product [Brachionus calyciflorus]